jgi:hypothetical protein
VDLQVELDTNGFAIRRKVASESKAIQIRELFEQTKATHQRRGAVFANRSALDIPAVQETATSTWARELVEPVLGMDAFAVRAIFFDKVDGANWSVPWHQDVTIAVKERAEVEGYGPWSSKEGSPHVQPPPAVLENMLSLRLHLDPCGADNGALRVIPGSHLSGKTPGEQIENLAKEKASITCECEVGDALLMRPLLLHASSPSVRPGHRRVLHIDYAVGELAAPLDWCRRI